MEHLYKGKQKTLKAQNNVILEPFLIVFIFSAVFKSTF